MVVALITPTAFEAKNLGGVVNKDIGSVVNQLLRIVRHTKVIRFITGNKAK